MRDTERARERAVASGLDSCGLPLSGQEDGLVVSSAAETESCGLSSSLRATGRKGGYYFINIESQQKVADILIG